MIDLSAYGDPKIIFSDGVSVVELSNGDKVLGQITRAGCMLGSCIASYCAAAAQMDRHNSEGQLFRGDMLTAAGSIFVLFIERTRESQKATVSKTIYFLFEPH